MMQQPQIKQTMVREVGKGKKPAMPSRAEIDIQMNDIEYKVVAGERKNKEKLDELD